MNASVAQGHAAPAGYVSEDARRRFTTSTAVWGVVFILAQAILPVAFVMIVGLFTMVGTVLSAPRLNLERAALWQGRIYYLESARLLGRPGTQAVTLNGLLPDGQGETQDLGTAVLEDPWLLPQGDRLWIISTHAAGYCAAGEMVFPPTIGYVTNISRPFLYEGLPAVVESGADEQTLRVLVADSVLVADIWQTRATFRLGLEHAGRVSPDDLQVVPAPDGLHLFLTSGGTLYHRQGIPVEDEGGRSAWEPVGPAPWLWTAVMLGGEPAVFGQQAGARSHLIVGLKKTDGRWEEFFSQPVEFTVELNVLPTGEGEDFLVLASAFPRAFRVLEVKGGKVIGEHRYGPPFPFRGLYMSGALILCAVMALLTLTFAFLLARHMRRDRVCVYAVGESRVPFASLPRRAVAQLVDGLILGAPVVTALFLVWPPIIDPSSPSRAPGLPFWGLILITPVWIAVEALILGALEGKWGRTPGKWLTGIRVVGTDLRPCGFRRAFVRNLLKFVDGFYNFMVGLLVAALTENWQRVGDLAARTIVIRSRRD